MDTCHVQDVPREGEDLCLCPCLGLTKEDLSQARAKWNIRNLKDLRRLTGAGTGCMACSQRLQEFLKQLDYPPSSSEPIFSDK